MGWLLPSWIRPPRVLPLGDGTSALVAEGQSGNFA